ncbi:polysaccharide pyruvyl transferase family protein [Vibrio sp. S11_S32]|uniref:polysaccharide pyruvyl transferase family protein n=1 Tax=Vibrio sp. S11_S32 TaxID=2720225 RepID=UPI001680CCF6|nr:polysaccharide pyruvyl transferase family protein [Vibrio sp. S11_S32]MBD1576851.1 polysaccharide pyruvyl transferase family protein [Vibrio sp. S11_S32]
MPLKLEYSVAKEYNFGDDLNPWLWPKLLGNVLGESEDRFFLGIGTVLTDKRINQQLKDAKEIVIFSSGAWGKKSCPTLTENCKVYGVRGPRTAKLLGLSDDYIIGDGAYLINQVDYPKADKIKGRIGFIPHHKSEDYLDWEAVCNKAGLTFISAKQPIEDFLIAIQQCESIIAEAMHGAIMADALRIHWIGVTYSPLFEYEKWFDFTEALGIKLELQPLPFIASKPLSISKNIENTFKKIISKLFISNEKWDRLPVVWSGVSADGVQPILAHINSIINGKKTQLSSELCFEAICNAQVVQLNKLKFNYAISGDGI